MIQKKIELLLCDSINTRSKTMFTWAPSELNINKQIVSAYTVFHGKLQTQKRIL